jgi:hypothetical protein
MRTMSEVNLVAAMAPAAITLCVQAHTLGSGAPPPMTLPSHPPATPILEAPASVRDRQKRLKQAIAAEAVGDLHKMLLRTMCTLTVGPRPPAP